MDMYTMRPDRVAAKLDRARRVSTLGCVRRMTNTALGCLTAAIFGLSES